MSKYFDVSDRPGCIASSDQMSQLYNRYLFVRSHSEGRDVLELACGPGFGLSYLAKRARSVTGADYDEGMVDIAKKAVPASVQVMCLDATKLPFEDASYDVICMLEAIYYLPDVTAFFDEARRVLRPGGELIIVSANREWHLFNPGAHTVRYLSAEEFRSELTAKGFTVEVNKVYPDSNTAAHGGLYQLAKKVAKGLGLIPKDASKKGLLKKFLGKTYTIPAELTDDMAPVETLTVVAPGESVTDHAILYVRATWK